MGAYIYFKTLPQNAREANAWLKQQPEQQFLHKLGCGLSFNDEEDIAWARKNNELICKTEHTLSNEVCIIQLCFRYRLFYS